jgi:general secretion pathway protein C
MSISSAPLRVAETLGVAAATFAAIAALGVVLAYWTWNWIAPRSAPSAPELAQTATLDPAYRLFGGTRVASAPAQAGFALVGVAASAGSQPGYAIVHDGTRTLVVREGDEAAPGVRVAEVHATRVVLERDGRREMLELPKRRAPAPGVTR